MADISAERLQGQEPELVPVPPPDRSLPDRVDREAEEKQTEAGKRNRVAVFFTSRRFWVTITIIVVIAAIIYFPYFFWLKAPELPLKMHVVDKTVPFEDRREHRGLFWLLGQNKFVDPAPAKEEQFYDFTKDYTGFYPKEDFNAEEHDPSEYGIPTPEQAEVESLEEAGEAVVAEDPLVTAKKRPKDWSLLFEYELLKQPMLQDRDVLYIADTYGVYTGDYWQFPEHDYAHTMHTAKIFGGLEPAEVEAMEWFADQDRLIIAEFNCFGSPTADDLRWRVEDLLGVSWTRWIGRYFIDFQDEKDVPYWLYTIYRRATGREWDVTGSGYVVCREESADFVILKDGEDVEPLGLELVPNNQYSTNDVMAGVKPCTFSYWFDILIPHEGTETLADFHWHVTPQGKVKLDEHGLPLIFPAVTRTQRGYTAYYMAGDVVDFDKAMGPPKTRLTLFINRSYYGQRVKGGQGFFFWHTYYPLVSNILRTECNRLYGEPEDLYLFD